MKTKYKSKQGESMTQNELLAKARRHVLDNNIDSAIDYYYLALDIKPSDKISNEIDKAHVKSWYFILELWADRHWKISAFVFAASFFGAVIGLCYLLALIFK